MKMLYTFTSDDARPLPAHVRIVESGGFADEAPCGELTGSIDLTDLSEDWSGGSLQITLFRPGDRPIVGGLQAEDAASLESPEREYGDRIDMNRRLMLPPGLVHIIVDIAPIRTGQGNRDFDFSRIRELHLNLGATSNTPVYIRNLRICDEQTAVGLPAAASPGDTITYMKDQTIDCYTYQLDQVEPPEEIGAIEQQLRQAVAELTEAADVTRLGGRQTLYAEAALTVAEIALKARRLYPWTNHPVKRRQDLSDALEIIRSHLQSLSALVRGVGAEGSQGLSHESMPTVPPVPEIADVHFSGNGLVDVNGKPVLMYAMNYHDQGPLLNYFAPSRHCLELFSVGGGSRFDIEWSPVHRAFHRNEDAKRVGYRGWCGHLIKDAWAMGGRKENVVICLESDAILEAVRNYNRLNQGKWVGNPHILYTILQYELMYICYCDKSVAAYRGWLKEKYGDIGALDEAWGESFSDFDDIVPPQAPDGVPPADTNRAAWFDWAFWNSRRFTDILLWSKRDIRQIAKAPPTCAGGTHSVMSANNANTGIDEELIVNEVDDVILHEGEDLLTLDLLRAFADKPKPVVDPEFGGPAHRVLQGFLHGKSTIAKYHWPGQPSRQYPHTGLGAPMQGILPMREVEEHFRIALDVRRLGAEISRFRDLPAEVAVHYSKTNILQVPYGLLKGRSTPHLQDVRACYDGARRLDAPVTFISERQILSGKASAYKLLILPATKHLPRPVFQAVDAFVRAGGTVLLTPETLLADEYAKPQDYLAEWGLDLQSVSIPRILGLGQAEQGYDQSFTQHVHFGEGRDARSTDVSTDFFGSDVPIQTSGIFQEMVVDGGDVLAREGDTPLLIRKPLGEGRIVLFCGSPTPGSLRLVADRLMDQSGVDRPLKLTAPDGSRPGIVEARLVRTLYYDLVYVINESNEPVTFSAETDRPFTGVLELRSSTSWPTLAGTIPPLQTLLFKLTVDPIDISLAEVEPDYPYAGA